VVIALFKIKDKKFGPSYWTLTFFLLFFPFFCFGGFGKKRGREVL
jgi:hypothetical protein